MRDADGEAWAYESIVDALPGLEVGPRTAVAIQLVAFEAAVLGLAWYYGLWRAALPGSVAVVVAAAGSLQMLRISRAVRAPGVPECYRRLLFGSSIEVVLAVVAFVALVTHLFVYDPRQGAGLLSRLLGPTPPLVAVFITLLVLWDLCYRIGTGWWAAVVGFWRSARYRVDPETAATLRRADRETLAFGAVQLLLVPFLVGHPLLLVALVGHVAAVVAVAGGSLVLLRAREL